MPQNTSPFCPTADGGNAVGCLFSLLQLLWSTSNRCIKNNRQCNRLKTHERTHTLKHTRNIPLTHTCSRLDQFYSHLRVYKWLQSTRVTYSVPRDTRGLVDTQRASDSVTRDREMILTVVDSSNVQDFLQWELSQCVFKLFFLISEK